MASKYRRAPFRMIGSKLRALDHLLPIIEPLFVKNSRFNDVFGGTGVVSLNVPKCRYHVFNDRNSGIIDFYTCFRDRYDDLMAAIRKFHPSSRQEFHQSLVMISQDPLIRAANWYYTIVMSYLGRREIFARNLETQQPTVHDKMKAWPGIRYFINNWNLENLLYDACMKDYDSIETIHYLDPPYIGTQGWCWTEEDLENMLDLCFQMEGTVIINHYPSKQIDARPWSRKECYQMYGSSAQDASRGQISECVWIKE